MSLPLSSLLLLLPLSSLSLPLSSLFLSVSLCYLCFRCSCLRCRCLCCCCLCWRCLCCHCLRCLFLRVIGFVVVVFIVAVFVLVWHYNNVMIHSGFQLVEIFGAPKCVSKTFLGSSREKLQASEPNCPQSQKKLMVSKPDCPRNPKKLKVLTKDWPLCPKREPTALISKLTFLSLRQKKLEWNEIFSSATVGTKRTK